MPVTAAAKVSLAGLLCLLVVRFVGGFFPSVYDHARTPQLMVLLAFCTSIAMLWFFLRLKKDVLPPDRAPLVFAAGLMVAACVINLGLWLLALVNVFHLPLFVGLLLVQHHIWAWAPILISLCSCWFFIVWLRLGDFRLAKALKTGVGLGIASGVISLGGQILGLMDFMETGGYQPPTDPATLRFWGTVVSLMLLAGFFGVFRQQHNRKTRQ